MADRPQAGRRAVRRRYAIMGVLADVGPASATLIAHKLGRRPGTIYCDLVWLEQHGLISADWTDTHLFPRRMIYRLESE